VIPGIRFAVETRRLSGDNSQNPERSRALPVAGGV